LIVGGYFFPVGLRNTYDFNGPKNLAIEIDFIKFGGTAVVNLCPKCLPFIEGKDSRTVLEFAF